MRTFQLSIAATLATTGLALAQTASPPSGTAAPNAPSPTNGMNVRQHIQSDLGKDGFTNITIMPSSFFVHATNKQGQSVAMVITPDSVTEVTEVGKGGSQPNGSSGADKPSTSTQK